MPECMITVELTAALLQLDIPHDMRVPLPAGIVRRLAILALTDSDELKSVLFTQLRQMIPFLSDDVGICMYTYLHYLAGGHVTE